MPFQPFSFMDPPQVLDATVTPIPAASDLPLQVIADTGNHIGVGLWFLDTTGEMIAVYSGAVGQEQLACIIGNGLSGQAPVYGKFPQHSRLSVRSMANATISTGKLTLSLVTS